MSKNNYWIYILTNPNRTALYTGMTNNLKTRLQQHFEGWENQDGSFTSRYFCYNLIYYEWHQYVRNAIAREKETKGWRREKKEALIATTMNPEWKFLNNSVDAWEW